MFRDCPVCSATVSDVAVTCPKCNAVLGHENVEVDVEHTTTQSSDLARRAGHQRPRAKLRRVAKYQRWVIHALLLHIFTVFIHLLFIGLSVCTQQFTLNPEKFLRGLIAIESIVTLYTVVVIFLLAHEIFGTLTALVYVILIFFPIISLIALAVLSHKAIQFLKGYGMHVGFFGVDPAVYEQW